MDSIVENRTRFELFFIDLFFAPFPVDEGKMSRGDLCLPRI
jgi:hypothetical protein